MDDLWIVLSTTKEYGIEDIGDILGIWAANAWNNATKEQQETILERWIDSVENSQDYENPPDRMDFNDFVELDCDDIFFPDEIW